MSGGRRSVQSPCGRWSTDQRRRWSETLGEGRAPRMGCPKLVNQRLRLRRWLTWQSTAGVSLTCIASGWRTGSRMAPRGSHATDESGHTTTEAVLGSVVVWVSLLLDRFGRGYALIRWRVRTGGSRSGSVRQSAVRRWRKLLAHHGLAVSSRRPCWTAHTTNSCLLANSSLRWMP